MTTYYDSIKNMTIGELLSLQPYQLFTMWAMASELKDKQASFWLAKIYNYQKEINHELH